MASSSELMKSKYILVQTKDEIFNIIRCDELIIHRGRNKLEIGDEVSWGAKTRSDQGRGKIMAYGTKQQCEGTKKVMEECSFTFKSSSTKKSSTTTKSPSTSKTSSRATSSSNKKHLCSQSYSTINNDNESSNTTARSSLPLTISSTIICSPSSSSSITFHSSSASISNTNAKSPALKDLTSSSDTSSETGLIIDENTCDDDNDELETNAKTADATSKSNQSICSNKRSLAQDEEEMPMAKHVKKNRASEVQKRISPSAYAALLRKKNKLASQLKRLKATWMPKPTDPRTIQYFIDSGKLLSHVDDDDDDENPGVCGKENELNRYFTILGIDRQEVEADCTTFDSITRTCRTLVGKLVPKEQRVNKSWSDIPFAQQNAIFKIARILNPTDKKAPGELKKACRNVFDVAHTNHQKKEQVETPDEDNSLTDQESSHDDI